MTTFKPPKPYKLSKVETLASFESWKHNQLYNLKADPVFKEFLAANKTWQKKGVANRGLTADAGDNGKSAEDKCETLNLMLDQIANWCPFISRTFLVKQCTSLNDVWQKIREHYGFLCTGGHFLDISTIRLESDERSEDLYQRIYMFFEDNLVTANSLSHNGAQLSADEEMTPSLENTITWLWLQLLNPGLPQLVKQRYGADLRNKTLASLKSEISQAMSSLLDELASAEESKVFRTGNKSVSYPRTQSSGNQSRKSCVLCKTAGRRYNNHWLSQCSFLPPEDKKALSRATNCESDEEDDDDDGGADDHSRSGDPYVDKAPCTCRRVGNMPSPILDVLFKSRTLHVTLDSGSTSNMILEEVAVRCGLKIHPATQSAGQADGISKLNTVGEVHFTVMRNGRKLHFDGLVVRTLSDDILGGMPFLFENDIGIRPFKSHIIIGGSEIIQYDSKGVCTPMVRRTDTSFVLKSPNNKTVVLPGETLSLRTPADAEVNSTWALEPRHDHGPQNWFPPQEVTDRDHEINIVNTTESPVVIKKHTHVCQVRSVKELDPPLPTPEVSVPEVASISHHTPSKNQQFSDSVQINPDNLVPVDIAQRAKDISRMYDRVFSPELPLYNGHSGNVQCHINMGPSKPPQRKARLPHYEHGKMVLLQEKFDNLEELGVLGKPEEEDVSVEYLNMSFLVPKPGTSDFRLVTAFSEIGEYSKPQPSVMPDIEGTLRTIGRWKYVIKTDLKQAYFQIPLSKESKRYAGTASPFKGVRVFNRAAMGLPGSETALEELMNRVVGHLIMEGCVTKVADDCYCGGDSINSALSAYERLLSAFAANNLGLNPAKTVIFPKRVIILGWVWEMGSLSASPHRIAALSVVEPPSTVKSLRSFIGAYKHLGRVIRWHSNFMNPLDQMVAGRDSKERINWTDESLKQFEEAKASLQSCVPIYIAKPSDQIWIQTDGALKPGASSISGLAATLFLLRDNEVLLGGFFNAQFKKGQQLWLPCEIEALAIGSAISYFSPIIIQSEHRVKVATDSKACVQAYRRMRKGQFSSSARVMTFLTAVCRYQVEVTHIAGIKIPFTDYASRHPIECVDKSCQVCKFVEEFAENVVRKLSVKDIVDGHAQMPFTNRQSWLDSQKQCQNLRKVHALLSLGTRPSKKDTKVRDVKSYLQKVVIAKDGLLVVRDVSPLKLDRERIVVPQTFIKGLLMAFHLRFEHPTAHQLGQVVRRHFYAINLDKHIVSTTESCDVCNSLKYVPDGLCTQTSTPPSSIGASFAFDIINRERQRIAVMRETLTSYTTTTFVDSESHADMRNALLILSAEMKGSHSEIRVDPAPGLACLRGDAVLKKKGVTVIPGDEKNRNKNPVAERAVQEIEAEILRIQPEKGPVSKVTLALATANTNSRVRRDGLSARELWTQRDQVTGSQLPFNDTDIKDSQSASRGRNHTASATSKARGRGPNAPSIAVGDLVYLVSERSKVQGRDKYLVTSICGEFCTVRKFTRTQFRRRTYRVPLTGVYPIVGSTSALTPVGDNSSSSDSDDDEQPDVGVPVSLSEGEGKAPEVQDILECAEGEGDSEVEEDQCVVECAARPRRDTKAPAWHADYEVG